MRDYVQRNFVDKGMCADWAIHDSENYKGHRSLHIYVLLTMRRSKLPIKRASHCNPNLTVSGEDQTKTKRRVEEI